MAVEFKKYQGGESTLTEVGTVREIVGPKGTIGLIRKNFNDATKRIAVVLTNAKNESAVVSCSKQVSDALRAKQMNLAQLAGLSIVENADGVPFISMPATGGLQTFKVSDLKETAAVEVKADFLPAELVAF